MHIFGGLLLIVAVWAAVNFGPTAVSRSFDNETRLGMFEERISNIPAEFVRRSPAFAQTWEDFDACMRSSACDPSEILARRDRVIAAEWPALFDRLGVFKDWGEARESRRSRDTFFRALREKGAEALRNRCAPKIEYRRLPGRNGSVVYSVEGYDCSLRPDRFRSG